MASFAEIEFTQRENPATGRMQDCVIASCTEVDNDSEPVWGHGSASVKRALASLKECPCGESFHKAADDEDEDD
jgi:hypothetical protein